MDIVTNFWHNFPGFGHGSFGLFVWVVIIVAVVVLVRQLSRK